MDPLGVRQPLRARRIAGDREPFVDRIQEEHFAATPERWFGAPGGFTVRVCGLPGGIAGTEGDERVADVRVAGRQLGRGDVTLTALELPSRGWRGPVRVELGLAAVSGAGSGTWRPNPAAFAARAGIDLDAAGVVGSATAGGGGPRRRARADAAAEPARRRSRALLPRRDARDRERGARIDRGGRGLASSRARASCAACSTSRSRRSRSAASACCTSPLDGSLYEAAQRRRRPDRHARGRRATCSSRPRRCSLAGPGAAWPPLPAQAEPRMLNRVPAAPGRGPAVMHGALPLRRTGGRPRRRSADEPCALAFAVQVEEPGGPAFRPFQRLAWTGRDPRSGTWTALDRRRAAGRRRRRRRGVRRRRRAARGRPRPRRPGRAVRVLGGRRDALPGRGRLERRRRAHGAHPPAPARRGAARRRRARGRRRRRSASRARRCASARTARPGPRTRPPTGASRSARSRRSPRRRACGAGACAGRRLCAWDREDWTASPPETLAPTRRGRLDVDVLHGLFAFSADEPPQAWPAGPGATIPPNVTTDYEEGATMHVGARPAAREPVLDLRLPRPTRLVSRSGALHPDAPADWHTIPRYDSLQAALAAVSAALGGAPAPRPATSPRSCSSRTARPIRTRRRSGRRRRRTRGAGGDAPVADDPGRRARASDRPRRSRPGLGAAGCGAAVRLADAARRRASAATAGRA